MPKNISERELSRIAKEIRYLILKMITKAGSGHPAGSLAMTDVFTVLYFSLLKHKADKPDWPERDYLILSNGHICPVWYASLARAGYFDKQLLNTLRKFQSPLQGHPHINSPPGVENTSGPLGQGISQACGLALGLKMDGKSNRVYCLMSDGEQQEGQVWEAYMFAAKYQLNNLTVLIDRNNIQIGGQTEEIMPLGNLNKKIKSFDWQVIDIDGHNFKQISRAIKKSWKSKEKPTAIICHTKPSKGIKFMQEAGAKWHGQAPTKEQFNKAIKELKT